MKAYIKRWEIGNKIINYLLVDDGDSKEIIASVSRLNETWYDTTNAKEYARLDVETEKEAVDQMIADAYNKIIQRSARLTEIAGAILAM